MFAVPQQPQPPSRLSLHHHVHVLKLQVPSCIRASITTTTPELEVVESRVPTPPILATSTTSNLLADDPSLKATWAHWAWVGGGCTSVLVSLAKAVVDSVECGMWAEPLLMGLLGYVLADLGTGVYHWAIDNYGDGSTPVFGPQIEAFQGHHRWPWTITRRQFANNLHALARSVALVVLPMDLAINHGVVHAFVGVCSGCVMFSQQFHAWAHGTKSRLPPIVVALQDAGILISRAKHGAHHRTPYNNNYCIVSGVWNEFLDECKFFEALEMVFFFRYGVRPRSWTEPNADWAEDTSAQLPSDVAERERISSMKS